jgi:voltage-gated potassium channel
VKQFLKSTLDDVDNLPGRYFAFFIQSMIVLSLISFSVETLPDLSAEIRQVLAVTERVLIGLFTVEYLLRLYVADNKPGYIFSFFGVIDLLAILPFYLSTGIDLRSIRIFRLLRLFRILKLLRYSKAIKRFNRALIIAKEELILFSCVAIMLLYLSAVGIYYFESVVQPDKFKSIFHSLWWALATLTTVGYGDLYPVTAGGQVFTFFILIIGLGVVAVPTGLVASALSQARSEEINNDA